MKQQGDRRNRCVCTRVKGVCVCVRAWFPWEPMPSAELCLPIRPAHLHPSLSLSFSSTHACLARPSPPSCGASPSVRLSESSCEQGKQSEQHAANVFQLAHHCHWLLFIRGGGACWSNSSWCLAAGSRLAANSSVANPSSCCWLRG